MGIDVSQLDRRRRDRIALCVPVMVTAMDPKVKFRAVCDTIDVSSSGAQLRLRHALPADMRVRLDIMDRHATTEARVISCEEEGRKGWRVRIQLLQQTGNFWGVRVPPHNWEHAHRLENNWDWHG